MKKIKISFVLLLCIFTSNCTISGSAFLGPAFTGVRTGSIYQSSLSYTSNKIINQIKTTNSIKKSKIQKIFGETNTILKDIPFIDKNPVIVLAHKVDKIEYSEVIEPEPLP